MAGTTRSPESRSAAPTEVHPDDRAAAPEGKSGLGYFATFGRAAYHSRVHFGRNSTTAGRTIAARRRPLQKSFFPLVARRQTTGLRAAASAAIELRAGDAVTSHQCNLGGRGVEIHRLSFGSRTS